MVLRRTCDQGDHRLLLSSHGKTREVAKIGVDFGDDAVGACVWIERGVAKGKGGPVGQPPGADPADQRQRRAALCHRLVERAGGGGGFPRRRCRRARRVVVQEGEGGGRAADLCVRAAEARGHELGALDDAEEDANFEAAWRVTPQIVIDRYPGITQPLRDVPRGRGRGSGGAPVGARPWPPVQFFSQRNSVE